MTFQGDPYRTLGVAPGASLNEIRSAYRRLAKKYHPDAAGERALPRFLAIQAAYEHLVDGEGRLRPPGWGSAAGGGPGSSGRAEPWRADPARARASRDAWRARRTAGAGPAHGGPAAGSGASAGQAAGPGGPGAGSRATGDASSGSRPPGGAGPSRGSGLGSAPGTGERSRHGRRGPRKATPGSTTYDEAAETPLDPEWAGGAWYGPSSGTYWTLNPREYADPRKHGPEYLARARRASGGTPAGAGGTPDSAGGVEGPAPAPGGGPGPATRDPAGSPRSEGSDETGEWQWTGAATSTTGGGEAEWGARGWTYDVRGDAGAAWSPGPERTARAGDFARAHGAGWDHASGTAPGAGPAAAAPLPDLEGLVRRAFPEALLTLAGGPDRRWRLLVALIAWPPIGYALGGLVSTLTGCARYAATCPEPVPLLVLLAQPLVLAALYALPPVAAVAAFATLAALAAAVPAGVVLAVGAMPRPSVEPAVLGAIVATTYVIAFAAGAVRTWRRPAPPRGS